MNKKLLFPLALVPLAATSLQAQKSAQTQRVDKRPNIILFMVDDMGWQDTSLPFWTQKTDYNKLYENTQHGTTCQTRHDVHTSVCQQYQFPHPMQPHHRNERGTPPGNQLDAAKEHKDRPQG